MFKCKCLPKSSFEDFLSAVGAEPRNPFLTTLLKYFALIRSPLAKHTCRNRESINANIVEEHNVSQRSYLNGREVEVENNPNTKWRVVGQREHQKGILSSKIWVPEHIDCGTKKPVQPLGFVGFLTCYATKPHGLKPLFQIRARDNENFSILNPAKTFFLPKQFLVPTTSARFIVSFSLEHLIMDFFLYSAVELFVCVKGLKPTSNPEVRWGQIIPEMNQNKSALKKPLGIVVRRNNWLAKEGEQALNYMFFSKTLGMCDNIAT